MTPDNTRAPGRPRSAEADQAILSTTLRLLAEQGYAGLSIEGIAGEAGVGKTTIYRRYEGKIDLVTAAISSLMSEDAPLPDTGDTYSDLMELMRQTIHVFTTAPIFSIVGTLLVEESRNPELFDIFRERIILPRKEQFKSVIEHGIQQGTIRSDASIDAATEMLVGAVYARHISGLPLTGESAKSVVDLIWKGLDIKLTG